MIRRRRWFAWLCVAAFIVLLQVTEEVVGQESTVVDRALLVDVHDALAPHWRGLFEYATLTASAHYLFPAVAVAAVAFGLARRWRDGLLLALSIGIASLVVYVAKTAFGRARPTIWDTQWYWGSSFPSGHTLTAAAVATATCLIVARVRPAWMRWWVPLAIAWVVLVGLSRLVLGVHWPTDVVAAACAGLLTTAAVHAALASLLQRKRA